MPILKLQSILTCQNKRKLTCAQMCATLSLFSDIFVDLQVRTAPHLSTSTTMASPPSSRQSIDYTLITNPDDALHLLDNMGQYQEVAMDLEGHNLGKDGTLSLITLMGPDNRIYWHLD